MRNLLFTKIDESPQLLLWVKCHGHPYWPAKVISVKEFSIGVQFFGDESVAFLEPQNLVQHCYIYSKENPFTVNKKRPALAKSIKEADLYIRNVIAKFGAFNYAERRTPFKPANIDQHLRDMIRPLSNTYAKSNRKQKSDKKLSLKRKKLFDPRKSDTKENKNSNFQLDQNKRIKFLHQAHEDITIKQMSSNVRNNEAILVAVRTPQNVEEINSSEEDNIINSTHVAAELETFETMPDKSNMKSSDNSMPSTSNSNNLHRTGSSSTKSVMDSMDFFRFITTEFEIASMRVEIEALKASNKCFYDEMKSTMEREMLHLITEAKTIIEIERNLAAKLN